MTTTQASRFAAKYAKNTAREMLNAVKRNARDAEIVTKIALGVSMPHQVGYILGMAPLQWDTLTHWMESLTLITGATGIPVAVDFLILICVRTVAARGAATVSKVVAFVAMLFPIGLSATVNFLAPAPMLLRALFGLVVVLVPISQGVRAMNRPDFRKVEAIETLIIAQAPAVAVAPAGPDPVRSERARRAAQTRRDRAERDAAAKAATADARRLARQQRRDDARANAAELFAQIAAEHEPGYADSAAPVSPAAERLT